jgi:hypothetical protein
LRKLGGVTESGREHIVAERGREGGVREGETANGEKKVGRGVEDRFDGEDGGEEGDELSAAGGGVCGHRGERSTVE